MATSIITISILAAASLSQVSAQTAYTNSSKGLPNIYSDLTQCLNEPFVYSCENTTAIQNTCCSPTPGGLVLQTQFWSTYTGLESSGQMLPKDSWTIHGLWPDNCDGSYQQYCDNSRQYDPTPFGAKAQDGSTVVPYTGPGVDTFVSDFGRTELLDYMNAYWINQGAPNVNFWGHEFSKHATCTSTFDTACYADYQPHQEVVNFFESVVRAFAMYPTYDILASFGIVPSNTTTYTLAQFEAAALSQTGAVPYFGCGGANKTILQQVYYYHHVLGSEQLGHYKTLNASDYGSQGCSNSSAIWYYERTKTSEHEVRNKKL